MGKPVLQYLIWPLCVLAAAGMYLTYTMCDCVRFVNSFQPPTGALFENVTARNSRNRIALVATTRATRSGPPFTVSRTIFEGAKCKAAIIIQKQIHAHVMRILIALPEYTKTIETRPATGDPLV